MTKDKNSGFGKNFPDDEKKPSIDIEKKQIIDVKKIQFNDKQFVYINFNEKHTGKELEEIYRTDRARFDEITDDSLLKDINYYENTIKPILLSRGTSDEPTIPTKPKGKVQNKKSKKRRKFNK